MTAHKHAKMIKAKVGDMDLEVFFKNPDGCNKWLKIENSCELSAFYEHYEYFLCHPKHSDVCLHWLNGGEVQDVVLGQFIDLEPKIYDGDWRPGCGFMNCNVNFRIKPRKEKRWIGYHKYGFTTASAYLSKDDALSNTIDHENWQFIEIEVEV